MTIQEKRFSKTTRTPGPTDYSPEKANAQTKPRERTPDFSRGTARKTINGDSNLGPGHYDVM